MSGPDLPTYLRGHSLSNADLATARGARQAMEVDEETAAKAARAAGGQRILGPLAAPVVRIALVVASLAALATVWLIR